MELVFGNDFWINPFKHTYKHSFFCGTIMFNAILIYLHSLNTFEKASMSGAELFQSYTLPKVSSASDVS